MFTGIHSFIDVKDILFNYSRVVSLLISESCELSLKDISVLSIEDGVTIYRVWWEVNKYTLIDFFAEEKTKTSAITWGELFTDIMLNGFSLDQIRKLTLRQIQLIYKSIQRKNRHKMAEQITAVSLGFNGGKEATKVVKELQK